MLISEELISKEQVKQELKRPHDWVNLVCEHLRDRDTVQMAHYKSVRGDEVRKRVYQVEITSREAHMLEYLRNDGEMPIRVKGLPESSGYWVNLWNENYRLLIKKPDL